MRKFILFFQEVRAPFFTAAILPVLLGTAIVYQQSGKIDLLYFILILLGSVFLHAGSNVANDYFDYKNGNDNANREFVRPFTGGSRLIQMGLLTPKEVMIEFIVLFAAGIFIFLFLGVKTGYPLILMGLFGVFSGYFYIAPPLFLSSRGVGELLIGLNFGPLLCSSAYYVQTGSLSMVPVLASLPIAFLIMAVLYINEFPDYKADKSVGKDNLVVRLGRKKAVYGYIALYFLAYCTALAGAVSRLFPLSSLLIFVSLPLAVISILEINKNYDKPSALKLPCALTVLIHLAGGLLFILGYLL